MGWGKTEKETPAQTSARITKQMQDNARKAQQEAAKGSKGK